jgi:ParB family chromosome partitioning protein
MVSRLAGLASIAEDETEVNSLSIDTSRGVFQGIPQLIEISKIKRSPFQPRSYFNADKIEKMAETFRKYQERGEHPRTAILVRPLEGNEYELVFGEQRTRAHQEAGFDTILAFVDGSITDAESRELALTENLLREDLNPIEKTEAILHLAAVRLQCSPEQVKQLLIDAATERNADMNNVIHTSEWRTLTAFFEELPGQLTPDSFRSNYLPLLNLPSDVIEAVHAGTIEYTKARAIGAVSDRSFRHRLLQAAIEESLSVRAIRERIKAFKQGQPTKAHQDVEESTPVSLPKRLTNLSQQMKKSRILKDPKKVRKVESLLEKLEALLLEADG